MKYFYKIGIILILLVATALGDSSIVVLEGLQNTSNSTANHNVIASNNVTQTNTNTGADDDDDDNTIYYVCGNDDIEKRCTCKNTTLSCNRGYYVAGLTHIKIKVRNENFTAKFVNFRYNDLQALKKDEILPGHESTVEELDLYGNNIKTIEDGAFDKFTSLKKLNLGNNYLKSINATILTKQLGTTLEELDWTSNGLQNLTTNVFHHLSKLQILNLRYNHNIKLVSKINGINVTIFPEALLNLKSLDLDSCNIKEFDDNVFINLNNLETLKISGNPFATVPKAIKMLPNLQHLYLESTKIVSINDCDFCGLPNLKTLTLTYSYYLTYIHENAFGALNNESTIPYLDNFAVRYCNISMLSQKLLNWKNASKIDIEGNDLVCNCSMAWLINDFNASKPLYVNKLIDRWGSSNKYNLYCHSPSALSGTHLHTLAENFCKNETILEKKDDENVYYVCGEDDAAEEDTTSYKGCDCREKYLDCSNYFLMNQKTLNHTNIQILKSNFTIEYADLHGNNITSLKKNKLLPGNEHTIKNLVLASNKIRHIENGTFAKFTSLLHLNLDGNNLTNIDEMIFPSTLQQLSLGKTNLDHIPNINYSSIGYLNLGENLFHLQMLLYFQKNYQSCNICFCILVTSQPWMKMLL